MKLAELTIEGFLDKTAGNDPVPGGGSISALNGAVAAALAGMVAGLTVGKKKYEDREDEMKDIIEKAAALREAFIRDIDADSDAYNMVFDAFKLPKETDDEKAVRSVQIQKATKVAAEIPLAVARRAYEIMDLIVQIAKNGNQNAITDAGVAMMSARTAVLGAILNVRINLGSLKDEEYVSQVSEETVRLEKQALAKEAELLNYINAQL